MDELINSILKERFLKTEDMIALYLYQNKYTESEVLDLLRGKSIVVETSIQNSFRDISIQGGVPLKTLKIVSLYRDLLEDILDKTDVFKPGVGL